MLQIGFISLILFILSKMSANIQFRRQQMDLEPGKIHKTITIFNKFVNIST